MRTITLLELKRNTSSIIREVNQGKRMLLNYRGKPAIQLTPLPSAEKHTRPNEIDPFYSLVDIAAKNGVGLSNEAIDKLLYGS